MAKKTALNIILLFTWFVNTVYAQDIFRFEHYDSENGLSQNSVASILCDRDGFLWVGTMNGLNRFDGYNFKVFDSDSNNNSFINNRVIRLWQDKRGFIWIKTYDHFYHYFNPTTEEFNTVPDYYDPNYDKINQATCFLQYADDEIWIGTNERGIYYLNYDAENNIYQKTQISDKGRFSITNNDVRFIVTDSDSVTWVGTQRGINLLYHHDLEKGTFDFQHYFINYSFNSAVDLKSEIWFATDKQGIISYNKSNASFSLHNKDNTPILSSNEIIKIYASKGLMALIALKNQGLVLYNPNTETWRKIPVLGNNIEDIYFDQFDNAWITTEKFGVTKVNLKSYQVQNYQLTDAIQKSITDRERHVFYEDVNANLWIGLHGGALAFYDRQNDVFTKYINDPSNNYSISSNIVHCITEDQSGQLWLGTGQYKGGLEKVIRRNAAFKHIIPTQNITQIIDNVVRCIYQDTFGTIWLSTKNGHLHIYSNELNKISTLNTLRTKHALSKNVNIYSTITDAQNHLWLGTKGHGLFVSTTPLTNNTSDYSQLVFYNYRNEPEDNRSLACDNIYSLEQDTNGNIWIGTYGNGISKTNPKDYSELRFDTYNSSTSNLTNDLVRKIKFDSDANLWVATSFGLNMLHNDSLKTNTIKFMSFFKEAGKKDGVNYNDIIEIFEDSKHQLWFGTFGGGVSTLKLPIQDNATFESITTQDGLSNDVVFGILEDDEQQIWLSSEYGLSRYNTTNKSFEVFSESNGLSFNNFSESTCYKLKDGRLLFGGSEGVEVISPSKIKKETINHMIKLTNFQLFNKDVVVGQKNSPLQKSISFTKAIDLQHLQSSFSIEYSALDFLDPAKIQYAFKLEGFENDWNYVGNQTKATYTNLPPGSYVFKVKNTTRNGQWSNYYKQLNINILPPWWKTQWAYASYILLVIAIIFIIRSIVVRVNNYRTELSVEKRINELKLRFFTNISHEIRTPLTLILGPLEDILYEGEIDDGLRNQLVLMKKNTKRMLKLVNQLLDFRRIQNNKMTLNVQELDLSKFTQSIYENFIPLAKHNGISFKLIKSNVPVLVWADAIKLDSIIYNLISNALKFTPQGKNVTVTITTDPEKNLALVNVSDQGAGISNDNISDIFTRFIILNKNDDRGSGIGLSLAYELAKLHSGDIQVTSEIDKGSCFCFSMPLNKASIVNNDHVKILELKETIGDIKHTFDNDVSYDHKIPSLLDKNKATILIVEDNTSIAYYIKNKLDAEFNCLIALNGKEGIEMAEIHNPDIIVTDIMMPEMNGIEMTKKLKQNFTLCHIPVVIMTAKSDVQDQIEGFDTGAEAYITKPLNSNHLKAIVRNFINQRKLIISKFRDNKTIDPNTLKVNSKDGEFLNKLLEYIEDNYSEDLSVEHVAEKFCMSRTVLYNKIKGLTGLSPLEFIRQVKLKLSLTLLQKGYSVTETAYKIGYTDVKYFSRQFKMTHGYSPSKAKKTSLPPSQK